MKQIGFVIKGNLKTKEKLKEQISAAVGPELPLSFYETEGSGDGIAQTKKAIEDGANYVIVAGGDGMVNELVNGYMSAEQTLREKVTLGVLPSGTGNDFIKSLGSPPQIEELVRLIGSDSAKMVDLGEVNYTDRNGNQAKRYFANITDVGLGGYVVENMEASGTFINADLTYQKAILQTFFTYKPVEVKLESEDFNWEGSILSLILANGRFFGSGLCISPDANLNDGKLGLVIMGKVSLWDYVKNLGKIKKGGKMDHAEVIYRPIGPCKITPLKGECPIDMDGEFIGFAPIEVRVFPSAVRFLTVANV